MPPMLLCLMVYPFPCLIGMHRASETRLTTWVMSIEQIDTMSSILGRLCDFCEDEVWEMEALHYGGCVK